MMKFQELMGLGVTHLSQIKISKNIMVLFWLKREKVIEILFKNLAM